jgi:hypothetical protein
MGLATNNISGSTQRIDSTGVERDDITMVQIRNGFIIGGSRSIRVSFKRRTASWVEESAGETDSDGVRLERVCEDISCKMYDLVVSVGVQIRTRAGTVVKRLIG